MAVKTGTTNSNKDAWTIGYTPSMVVGVWAGNNDNKPMKKGGVAVAGPIWNKFMKEAMQAVPREEFEIADLEVDPSLKPILRGVWQGNQTFYVDKVSGKLATENTPPETREERVITNVHSILHWVDRSDILGPPPGNPESNPQYRNWETTVQNWWSRNSYEYPVTNYIPTETDDVHTDSSKPVITILEPNPSKIYRPGERVRVSVTAYSLYPIQKIDIFVNDTYIGTSPYSATFSFAPSELPGIQSLNELKIIAYDTAFNSGSSAVIFNVAQ